MRSDAVLRTHLAETLRDLHQLRCRQRLVAHDHDWVGTANSIKRQQFARRCRRQIQSTISTANPAISGRVSSLCPALLVAA